MSVCVPLVDVCKRTAATAVFIFSVRLCVVCAAYELSPTPPLPGGTTAFSVKRPEGSGLEGSAFFLRNGRQRKDMANLVTTARWSWCAGFIVQTRLFGSAGRPGRADKVAAQRWYLCPRVTISALYSFAHNARCTKCAIKSILQEPFRDRAPLWLSLEMSRILQWKQHRRALTEMN
jgi:hypothetical protein